eukprot:TRINITY_DN2194_c0_g1_i1.p1 TRINITY_DN2194_c0_g1~~TRINITY_DN2194_c0_g1_i1.p1  ORF type:complete len:224 (+),score=40.54 TRINITY_DN2194_c0_g1_i1:79-750(+)
MDASRLEADEENCGDALKFWKAAQAYAREECSYLRTRADRIEAKGARDMTESHANVSKIETKLCSKGKRVRWLRISYDDGTFRQAGINDTDSLETFELQPGEKIRKVEIWKESGSDYVAEGIKMTMHPDGREMKRMGKDTKGFFGSDSVDKIYEVDGEKEFAVDLKYDGHHPIGIVTRKPGCKPGGTWEESVDSWRFDARRLVYTIGDRVSFFIPLPYETLQT